MLTSFTEENYLKTIHRLMGEAHTSVSTNSIAEAMQTKASSVTDMIKKLCDKKLLDHVPYQGVTLTESGSRRALDIIRKHRLWEVFLAERLGMGWDEVHDIAEQLEHTSSEKLYAHLDRYLGYPKFDPHGDPIPDASGQLHTEALHCLADEAPGIALQISRITVHLPDFLQFLHEAGLVPGTPLRVLRRFDFDGSITVQIEGHAEMMVSRQTASHIFVKRI